MSESPPSPPSPHPDLVGMLTGELPPSRRAPALAHVRGCDACRDEIIVVAAALGELRDAGRHAPVDPSEVPPLRLDRSDPGEPAATDRPVPSGPSVPSGSRARRRTTRSGWARTVGVPVAAVLLVLAGLGIGLGVGLGLDESKDGGGDPPGPVAVAAPVAMAGLGGAPAHAAGSATMAGHDDDQTMQIALVGLPPPTPGMHYTVWLIDTRHHHRALSVGVMPDSDAPVMRAVFALPEAEVSGYDAVDVSQEYDSFAAVAPAHSLLRGSLV